MNLERPTDEAVRPASSPTRTSPAISCGSLELAGRRRGTARLKAGRGSFLTRPARRLNSSSVPRARRTATCSAWSAGSRQRGTPAPTMPTGAHSNRWRARRWRACLPCRRRARRASTRPSTCSVSTDWRQRARVRSRREPGARPGPEDRVGARPPRALSRRATRATREDHLAAAGQRTGSSRCGGGPSSGARTTAPARRRRRARRALHGRRRPSPGAPSARRTTPALLARGGTCPRWCGRRRSRPAPIGEARPNSFAPGRGGQLPELADAPARVIRARNIVTGDCPGPPEWTRLPGPAAAGARSTIPCGGASHDAQATGGRCCSRPRPRVSIRCAGDASDGRRAQGGVDRRAAHARHPDEHGHARLRDHVARQRVALHVRQGLQPGAAARRVPRRDRQGPAPHHHPPEGGEVPQRQGDDRGRRRAVAAALGARGVDRPDASGSTSRASTPRTPIRS